MPIYTSDVKKTGDAEVHHAGTGATINDKFIISGGGQNGMRARSEVAFTLGETGEAVPTGTDAYVIALTNGALQFVNEVPSGKVVTISFWGITGTGGPTSNDKEDGHGFTALYEDGPDENDDLVLEIATASNFGAGVATVYAKWEKSTTTLDPAAFSELPTLGTIRGLETTSDWARYSGGASNEDATTGLKLAAYKITFKTTASNYIRLKGRAYDSIRDEKFLYDLRVIIEDHDDENTSKIASRESLTLQIDKDSSNIGGTHKFSFTAGDAGTEVANIDESGEMEIGRILRLKDASEHGPSLIFANSPAAEFDSGDNLGAVRFYASEYDRTLTEGAYIIAEASENWVWDPLLETPKFTNMGTRMKFAVSLNGSGQTYERMTLDGAGNLQIDGNHEVGGLEMLHIHGTSTATRKIGVKDSNSGDSAGRDLEIRAGSAKSDEGGDGISGGDLYLRSGQSRGRNSAHTQEGSNIHLQVGPKGRTQDESSGLIPRKTGLSVYGAGDIATGNDLNGDYPKVVVSGSFAIRDTRAALSGQRQVNVFEVYHENKESTDAVYPEYGDFTGRGVKIRQKSALASGGNNGAKNAALTIQNEGDDDENCPVLDLTRTKAGGLSTLSGNVLGSIRFNGMSNGNSPGNTSNKLPITLAHIRAVQQSVVYNTTANYHEGANLHLAAHSYHDADGNQNRELVLSNESGDIKLTGHKNGSATRGGRLCGGTFQVVHCGGLYESTAGPTDDGIIAFVNLTGHFNADGIGFSDPTDGSTRSNFSPYHIIAPTNGAIRKISARHYGDGTVTGVQFKLHEFNPSLGEDNGISTFNPGSLLNTSAISTVGVSGPQTMKDVGGDSLPNTFAVYNWDLQTTSSGTFRMYKNKVYCLTVQHSDSDNDMNHLALTIVYEWDWKQFFNGGTIY